MPERLKLTGVALCEPYEQGDFDNLCGLYAALNAIRLVMAPTRPISRVDANELFLSGIDYLNRRKALADVLEHGMDYRRQHAVTRHMAKSASRITGISVTVEQVFPSGRARAGAQPKKHTHTPEEVISGIADWLSLGAPVIFELRKTHHHYTVIAGLSPSRVSLFDSDGLRWVERRALATTPNCTHRRHHVPPASLLAVTLKGHDT